MPPFPVTIDGQRYPCDQWEEEEKGRRLVEGWGDGWAGGMGETMRRSRDGYYFGVGIDASSKPYIRLHPMLAASIALVDLDARKPFYIFEALGPAATIGFDAASTGKTASATSLTISHTVGAGEDRILVARISWGTIPTFGSVTATYGGIAMAVSFEGGASPAAGIYYLVNPPVGTADIVFSWSGSTPAVAGATSRSGVDQTTPLGPVVSAGNTNATATVDVPSAVGEVVEDVMAVGNVTASVGAGQTQRWNDIQGTDLRGCGSDEAGAASVTMSWSLGASGTWFIAAVSLKPGPARFVYVLNGQKCYKIDAASNLLKETKTFSAGAEVGRRALFEGKWKVPLGESVDAQELTTVAAPPANDTWSAITGIKARQFGTIQDGPVAMLVRAHNTNLISLSSDGSSFGDTFEAGDSSLGITDLLTVGGEIMVIRPDGPLRFDAQGNSLPVQEFVGRNPDADPTMGSNGHAHGLYAYWLNSSGIWRTIGEQSKPVGPEADPQYFSLPVDDANVTVPFMAGGWRSITAFGRWAYGTRYGPVRGQEDGRLYFGYINDDGTIRWHGSLFDSVSALRCMVDSLPSLWFVDGIAGVATVPTLKRMDLQSDGSLRTAIGANRGMARGTAYGQGRMYEPETDFDLPDRQKQLCRTWVVTEGMPEDQSASALAVVHRDGGAAQTVGAGITTDGLIERAFTRGTDDLAYRVMSSQRIITTPSYEPASSDPRIRGYGIEARTASILRLRIPLTPKALSEYDVGVEDAAKSLRALQNGPQVAILAPERTVGFNAHVVAVQETILAADAEGLAYRFDVFVETFDIGEGLS